MQKLTVEEALALIKRRKKIDRIKPLGLGPYQNILFGADLTKKKAEEIIRGAQERLLLTDPIDIKRYLMCRLNHHY